MNNDLKKGNNPVKHDFMTIRIDLERKILGACLLENSFFQVADILSYKNFSKGEMSGADHQLIFKTMEKLYPLRPVDAVSVFHSIKSDSYLYCSYIAELMGLVSTSSSLKSWALILFETDIREKFIQQLQRIADPQYGNVVFAAANEIIDELLDQENDVFLIIPKAISYLRSIADEATVKGLDYFFSQVSTRIEGIRTQVTLESIFSHLERQRSTPLPIKAKVSLNKLIEEAKGIIVTGKIDDSKAEKILNL